MQLVRNFVNQKENGSLAQPEKTSPYRNVPILDEYHGCRRCSFLEDLYFLTLDEIRHRKTLSYPTATLAQKVLAREVVTLSTEEAYKAQASLATLCWKRQKPFCQRTQTRTVECQTTKYKQTKTNIVELLVHLVWSIPNAKPVKTFKTELSRQRRPYQDLYYGRCR